MQLLQPAKEAVLRPRLAEGGELFAVEQRLLHQLHQLGGRFIQIVLKAAGVLLIQLYPQVILARLGEALHAGEDHFLIPWLPHLPDVNELLQPFRIPANGEVCHLVLDVAQAARELLRALLLDPVFKLGTFFEIKEVQKPTPGEGKLRIRRIPVHLQPKALVHFQVVSSLKDDDLVPYTAADLKQRLAQVLSSGIFIAGTPKKGNQLITVRLLLHAQIIEYSLRLTVRKVDLFSVPIDTGRPQKCYSVI